MRNAWWLRRYVGLALVFGGVSQPSVWGQEPLVSSEDAESAVPKAIPRELHYDSSQEAGPHHRWVVLKDGKGDETGRYMDLATGLNRWDPEGESWREAFVQIELFEGAAISRNTAYTAILSAGSDDPNGVFDILMPAVPHGNERERFRGKCIGIAYTDRRTGRSVFIAETRNVAGWVAASEVLYEDCFDGDGGFSASLRFRLSRAGIAQDVILGTRIPTLEEAGLEGSHPADVAVEVWTRVMDAPAANTVQRARRRSGREVKDTEIDFGQMRIGLGRAFPLGARGEHPPGTGGDTISVTKEYLDIENERYLIEAVSYADLRPRTDDLRELVFDASRDRKAAIAAASTLEASRIRVATGSHARVALPARRERLVEGGLREETQASETALRMGTNRLLAASGYVLDYELQGGYLTNFTFQSDTTYNVLGSVECVGRTVFEGGAVIKYHPIGSTNHGTISLFSLSGPLPVEMQTGPYNPVIFCSKNDNSVGSVIADSTGTPSKFSYGFYLGQFSGPGPDLRYFVIRDAQEGILFSLDALNPPPTVSHAQMVRCSYGIGSWETPTNALVRLQNVLFVDGISLAQNHGYSTAYSFENVTVLRADRLFPVGSTASYSFTNCLFVNVTNLVSVTGANNASTVDSGALQTMGGGSAYLASNSAYRNAGTHHIDSRLAAELKQLTTYPPVEVADDITADTTLAPVVERDTDAPDIGYHYPVIDYLTGDRSIANAALILTNGVAVGVRGTNGFVLRNGSSLYSNGWADRLNTNGAAWVNGPAGTAVNFDGIDEYVQIGAQTNLILTSAGTISAFVSPDAICCGIIVNKESAYELSVMGGTLQWAFANASPGWFWVDTGIPVPTNEWTHVTVTYENGLVRAYGNGVLAHTYFGSGDIPSYNFDFRIGGRQGKIQYLDGRIDDVRVYSRALSPTEMAMPRDEDIDGMPDYLEDANGNGALDSGETSWTVYNSGHGLSGIGDLRILTPLK